MGTAALAKLNKGIGAAAVVVFVAATGAPNVKEVGIDATGAGAKSVDAVGAAAPPPPPPPPPKSEAAEGAVELITTAGAAETSVPGRSASQHGQTERSFAVKVKHVVHLWKEEEVREGKERLVNIGAVRYVLYCSCLYKTHCHFEPS